MLPYAVLRVPAWVLTLGTLSTHALLTQNCSTCSHNEERARACVPAVPSGSNASDVASTTAPHCAASFEFSAESAEIVVSRFVFAAVRFAFAAVSSVFAATSFSFRAVSAPILSTYLRRARHDSCRGVECCLTRGKLRCWRFVCAAHGPRHGRRSAYRMAFGARCAKLLHPRLEVGQAQASLLLGEQRS